jgi:hypothetical protein
MGAEITTTVLIPASTYDLTDLATARLELNFESPDTSADTFLALAITQASSRVSSYCDRIFQVETISDVILPKVDAYPSHRGGTGTVLQLSRWPVVDIISVTQEAVGGTTVTLIEGTDFEVDRASGQLIRLGESGAVATRWPSDRFTVEYRCGYARSVYRVAGIIPAATAFTITVAHAAAFIADAGVVFATSGTALTPVDGAPAAGEYSVSAGIYTFNAVDASKGVRISYSYAEIPADVVDAVLRLITARYKARGRDPLMRSQGEPNIGQTTWWVGTPGISGSMPEEIAGILDNYRVPSLG